MVTEEEWELVEKRIEAMPEHIKIAYLGKVYSKEEILQEVRARTEVGKLIAEAQLKYLRAFRG